MPFIFAHGTTNFVRQLRPAGSIRPTLRYSGDKGLIEITVGRCNAAVAAIVPARRAAEAPAFYLHRDARASCQREIAGASVSSPGCSSGRGRSRHIRLAGRSVVGGGIGAPPGCMTGRRRGPREAIAGAPSTSLSWGGSGPWICALTIPAELCLLAQRVGRETNHLGKLQELSGPEDLSCAETMPMVREGCGFLKRATDTDAERVSTATAISGIKVTPMPALTI